MESVRSRDGTAIAFERTGTGPSLILVNGALSDRKASRPLAEILAPHFSVLSFDRRGRGDSGDLQPYAVEREIEDIAALIAAAGGSAFVFGHSSGAALSLKAAARGLPIPRLALYEPPFIVDSSRPPLPGDYFQRISALLAEGRRGEAVEYFLSTGPAMPGELIARMRKTPMWAGLEALANTLPYDGLVMGDTMAGRSLPEGAWAGAKMPVLVMAGGASPAWAANSVRALASVLPDARSLMLEGQTHGASPESLLPALKEFFLA